MRHRLNGEHDTGSQSSERSSEMNPESQSSTLGTIAISRSNESDPAAVKDLLSKADRKRYFMYYPQTEGVRLVVKYAGDDAPESD